MSNTIQQIPGTPSKALLISVSKVAELLGVSDRTVWRMESKGDLVKPALRRGGVVRWRRHEIEQWIENGCPSQQSEAGR